MRDAKQVLKMLGIEDARNQAFINAPGGTQKAERAHCKPEAAVEHSIRLVPTEESEHIDALSSCHDELCE